MSPPNELVIGKSLACENKEHFFTLLKIIVFLILEKESFSYSH